MGGSKSSINIKINATISDMNATKLSISLEPAALKLLDQVKRAYGCRSRSQAVARSLQLFKELTEQQALEKAYSLSSEQDVHMNAQFVGVQDDGLKHEAW
jgi:hypothetical protein